MKPPARAVLPAPAVPVLRRCACGGSAPAGGGCAECRRKRLQRSPSRPASSVETAPRAVHDVLRSPGQPLDAAARAFMEPRFGHSFANVRVHADARAAESASAVGARAYAVGNDVVFGRGTYSPASPDGRRLIAHELAHVVQQSGSAPAMSPSLEVGPVDAPEERAADAAAEAVTSMPERPAPRFGSALAQAPARVARKESPTPTLGEAPPSEDAGAPCPKDRDAAFEDARRAASVIARGAYERVAALAPEGPARPFGGPGERGGSLREARVRALAVRLLGDAGRDLERVGRVLDVAGTRLAGALPRVCSSPQDEVCGIRDAYVRGTRPPVHVCRQFFGKPAPVQSRILLHEAMHMAGIGDPQKEEYCMSFDCESRCAGPEAADSWAHFAHCAAGHAPDAESAP